MKQVTLSKKDVKDLNKEIESKFGLADFFSKDDRVALIDETYVVKEGEYLFFYKEAMLLPTLKLLLEKNFLKRVFINMGAVPFIAKGADLMRPGIVGVDTYVKENDIVSIVDERNEKPIAVGQAVFSKDEMQEMETGKMVLNLHHVGDEVWKAIMPKQ